MAAVFLKRTDSKNMINCMFVCPASWTEGRLQEKGEWMSSKSSFRNQAVLMNAREHSEDKRPRYERKACFLLISCLFYQYFNKLHLMKRGV